MNEKILRQIIRESLVGLIESVKEKAVSKSQQRFFGMVDAYKKGELDDASKAVKDAAEGMSMKQVKDFAKTKHKGLPNHVDESVLRSIIRETVQTHLVNVLGKYTQGKVSSKEANKAIMDLANSSNQKKLNEEIDARTLEYFNKIRNGECETLEWEGRIFRVPPQLKQIARQVSEEFNVVASPYVYQNDSSIYCALLVDAPEDCDFYTMHKNVQLFLLEYDLHYIGCYHRTIFFVRQILEKNH